MKITSVYNAMNEMASTPATAHSYDHRGLLMWLVFGIRKSIAMCRKHKIILIHFTRRLNIFGCYSHI